MEDSWRNQVRGLITLLTPKRSTLCCLARLLTRGPL